MPTKLQTELKANMEAAGIPVPETEERWGQALEALKVLVFLPLDAACHGLSVLWLVRWLCSCRTTSLLHTLVASAAGYGRKAAGE